MKRSISIGLDEEEIDVFDAVAHLRGVKRAEVLRSLVVPFLSSAVLDPHVAKAIELRRRARHAAGKGQRILRLATKDGIEITDREEVQ